MLGAEWAVEPLSTARKAGRWEAAAPRPSGQVGLVGIRTAAQMYGTLTRSRGCRVLHVPQKDWPGKRMAT